MLRWSARGCRPHRTIEALIFEAPDIDELGRALEARGVAFLGDAKVVQRTATHDLKLREFLDPDGDALAIMGLVALIDNRRDRETRGTN